MVTVGYPRRLVATTAVAAALLVATVSGAAPGTGASVTTFDQCANGAPPSTSTGCPENWINGILNSANSHYAEDDVTSQRVILELPKNSPATERTVEISSHRKAGCTRTTPSRPGTTPRRARTAARTSTPRTASRAPRPPSRSARSHRGGGQPRRRERDLGAPARRPGLHPVRRNPHGVSAYRYDDAGGTSDSYAHVTLTYSVPSTADGAKVMLLFAAHRLEHRAARGWGVGVGAGSISGGPYHVRITAADGESVGNRDNQIQSERSSLRRAS